MSQRSLEHVLGPIEMVPEGGSAGFEVTGGGEPLAVMVVRRGGEVRAYVNVCPHWGSPLDIEPGRFLDRSGQHIVCTTHGALFRIDDGYCFKGPCLGARLRAVPTEVRDGLLVLID